MLLWLLLIGRLLHARLQGRGRCQNTHAVFSYLCTGLSNGYETLARKNSVYYPLLVCLLNFGIGMYVPHNYVNSASTCCTGIWFVGELLSGTYGIVSAHGLIVANTYIPGSMTYLHGCCIVSYYNYASKM